MLFTKQQVYEVCKKVATALELDPKLMYAVCLQEGGKNNKGEFTPDIARLEQGFYRRYVEGEFELATTSEVLLAASYGVMQMMGESLRQVGYFDWWFNQQSNTTQARLAKPLSQIAVVQAIDFYCINLEVMIVWGGRWMKKKMDMAKGSLPLFCKYWNGDSTGKYYNELMIKYNSI